MRFISALFLIITLSSCSTTHTTSITIPKNFDKGNEISASAAISPTGLNATLSYSPINHVFIHGLINNMGTNPGNFHHTHQYGIGGYYNLNKAKLEIEVGYGKGKYDWRTFNPGGGYYSLELANGKYSQFYGSISATFNNLFGVTLRYGETNSTYSYVESPFEIFYPLNTLHQDIYFGGLVFIKKETEFGLSFYGSLAIDRFQGDGINGNYPFQLGVGMKYNLNFSRKD